MNKTAVALGTFDGVHAGHTAVLKAAADSGFKSVVVAFKLPPKCFYQDKNIVLTDEKTKTRLIKKIGIKQIDYIDFNEVKDIWAEDFFEEIRLKFSPALIVCGYNYTFGKGGSGDTHLLKKLCDKYGITLKVIERVKVNGEIVSSSLIRNLLKNGETQKAVSLLPDGFSITAKVIHGDKRGSKINFPTFNQYYPDYLAKVKFGVYMVSAEIDGKVYYGMTNIGIRPTFPVKEPLCETNLFDFDGDLYGKEITIKLLRFIREEKVFSSIDDLIKAIENNKKEILEILKKEK